ncbi:MAG: radical SAM protein [Candidatus Muiribacteriota bacterium]
MNAASFKIKLSYGTAVTLGLKKKIKTVDVKTAYVLYGDKCEAGCEFCSQNENQNRLSRVSWPEFLLEEFIKAFDKSEINNICFQVTKSKKNLEEVFKIIKIIKNKINKKFTISLSADFEYNLQTVNEFLANGVHRIGFSMDCVSESKYFAIKKGDYNKKIEFLKKIAAIYKDKISTHLIIGIGESANEAVNFVFDMIANNIKIALFAFTPVRKNGVLADKKEPSIVYYRLIQAVLFLAENNFIKKNDIVFNNDEKIKKIKLNYEKACKILSDGFFLKTTGCENCNRPFYNEKYSGIWYNYPRKPEKSEVNKELNLISSFFEC